MGETEKNLRRTMDFSDLVASKQRGISVDDRKRKIPTIDYISADHLDTQVMRAWNDYGEGYIAAESREAFEVTVFMLLENIRKPNAKRERWASLGAGPGLYELAFAKLFNRMSMITLDLSIDQLMFQARMLEEMKKQDRNFSGNISLVAGTMSSIAPDKDGTKLGLPLGTGIVDQMFCINSLHWVRAWRSAVSEINRVLKPEDGARAYIVTGSAPIITKDKTMDQVAEGLDTDTLLGEFESHGLMVSRIGYLNIGAAQFGIPTERFYCVVERDHFVKEDWNTRVIKGEVRMIDYTTLGKGMIEIKDLTSGLRNRVK